MTGQRPQVEQILAKDDIAMAAFGGVDEQGGKAGKMFRAGLDGLDPATLAFVEIGRRQEIADGEDAGQRRAHLMGEDGQRQFDDPGSGLLGHAPALSRHCRDRNAFFLSRPPFRRPLATLGA